MSKNYKWGIFPGKWGAKAKKAAPPPYKKRGSLPRNLKAGISRDASRFRRSGAPSPAGTNVPAGDGAPEAIRFVPKHASRGIRQCRSSGTTERHSPNGQPTSRQRSGNTAACGQRAYTSRAAKRRRFQSRKQCPRIKRITDRRIADRRSFQDAGAMLLSETPYLSRICTFARKSGQRQNKTDRRSEHVRTPVCFAARRTSTTAGSCPPRVVFDSAQAAYVFLPLACQNIVSTSIRLKSTSDSIADKASHQ